jgi:hypothetical protein
MARPGSGFVSISDYLGANQGTLANEHAALAGLVGGEYNSAKSAADQVIGSAQPGTDYTATPGYSAAVDQINAAQQDQTNLGTTGGVQDLLKRQYGANDSQAAFDASLLGTQQVTNPDLMAYLNTGAAVGARPYPQAPALPGQSGSAGARHNRPSGPRNPEQPPEPYQPYDDPSDVNPGPEDGFVNWTEGSNDRPESWNRSDWRTA